MTALAVMAALIGAMFVAFAPARAHDLGECSNPEYLTAYDCRTNVAVDADNDPATDPVVSADGTAPANNDPWTAGTHSAGNHPPTLSITVLDSDGIVPDDSTVTVLITVANIHTSRVADANTDGTVTAAEMRAYDESALTFEAHPIDFVRVSGELEGPSTPDTRSAANGFLFTQTGSVHDDNSVGTAVHTIIIPAGTSPGEYTVSTRLVPRTGGTAYYDYSGNDFVTKSARATFTVGGAGVSLSSAELSLANRVHDDPATLTDETKAETGKDSATGDGINLLVSASNSLGNKANNGDIDQITVIAPGGTITINSPRSRNPAQTARPADRYDPANTIPIFTASTADNSSSLSEAGVTKNTALGDAAAQARADAIQQAMSININKANDEPGTVDVYVILSGKGAAISNTITLTFTGPNDALAIGEASETLLAFAEVTELPEVLRRDIISFAVSATDEGGNAGAVPSVRTRILDPEGKVVNQEKISVVQGPDGNDVPNAKLTLTSLNDSLSPLDVGTYSIKISTTAGLSAEGSFEVVGRADGVDLSVDTSSPSAVGEIVTATATVTSGGQPVPNGTVVTFAASDVTGDRDSVLVAVGGGTVQRAIGGVAEATFVAVGSGRSVISATAHRTTDVQVITSTAGAGVPVVEVDPDPALASISVEVVGEDHSAGRITVLASLADADGEPVEGMVSFYHSGDATLFGPRDVVTSGGTATAEYDAKDDFTVLAVAGSHRASLSIAVTSAAEQAAADQAEADRIAAEEAEAEAERQRMADEAAAAEAAAATEAAAAEAARIAATVTAETERLSGVSGFTSWLAEGSTTASELFAALSAEGATALHVWNGTSWVRYSVVDGTTVPGSVDFDIERGDVLFISN